MEKQWGKIHKRFKEILNNLHAIGERIEKLTHHKLYLKDPFHKVYNRDNARGVNNIIKFDEMITIINNQLSKEISMTKTK